MSVLIKGATSGLNADVDQNECLMVNHPLDPQTSGIVVAAGEVHGGSTGASRICRTLDVSPDYRLRVGMDSLLWSDVFNHTQFNISKYIGIESTMTKALTGNGRLAFNNGNSVASGASAIVKTWRTFPLYLSYATYVDMEVLFTQAPTSNNVCEWGLGYAAGITAPTDGVFFRLNGSGALQGVMNNNGTEFSVVLAYTLQPNTVAHYLIVINHDRVEFFINDTLYGFIARASAAGIGAPMLATYEPLLFREYNSAMTSVAQRMELASVGVSLGDMNTNRLWATAAAGMGNSSINTPDSVVAGQTANSANSTAPVSATLSNTAAGYTNLGGQFQFAAVAGSETDYAIFAFQLPIGSAGVPAKTLILRGIRIESAIMGAAVATTATLLQWALGIGSSAVSLATTDSASAGTKAPRRIMLGLQSFAVGAGIGAIAVPVDINLDAPLAVDAGSFVHIILKIPVGTATTSQIIRGTVMFNGYFE